MIVVPVSFGVMVILGLIGFAIVGLSLLPSMFDSWVRRISKPSKPPYHNPEWDKYPGVYGPRRNP